MGGVAGRVRKRGQERGCRVLEGARPWAGISQDKEKGLQQTSFVICSQYPFSGPLCPEELNMRRLSMLIVIGLYWSAPPAQAFDSGGDYLELFPIVGEPQNGFPSWYERFIHLMVNRSRANPPADLESYTRITYKMPPSRFWGRKLMSAQFWPFFRR